MILPQSYKQIWLEEHSRIPHHQLSQIESRRAIIEAVNDRKITVDPDKPSDKIPVLDEYENAESDGKIILRILQGAKWLTQEGKIPQDKLSDVESKENPSSIISDAEANQAFSKGRILAKVLTLRKAFEYGLLDDLCDNLQVRIDESEYNKIGDELRAQEAGEKAGEKAS